MSLDEKKLDYTQLSTFKMLIHSLIPRKCQKNLRSKKCLCLRKTDVYQLFDKGLKQYENEINIVKLMRTIRYNNAVIA